MNLKDVRRLNLLLLQRTEFGNLASQLAKHIRRKPSQVSQWYMGYRTISEETARDIEDKCHKPSGWLDVIRTELWGESASSGQGPATIGRPQKGQGSLTAERRSTVVVVREPEPMTPAATGRAWPHTALTAWQWQALSEHERMQVEAAMLQAYALVMRHRQERQEQQESHPPQAVANGAQ